MVYKRRGLLPHHPATKPHNRWRRIFKVKTLKDCLWNKSLFLQGGKLDTDKLILGDPLWSAFTPSQITGGRSIALAAQSESCMNHCHLTPRHSTNWESWYHRPGNSEDQARWGFVSLMALALQTALLTADNCQKEWQGQLCSSGMLRWEVHCKRSADSHTGRQQQVHVSLQLRRWRFSPWLPWGWLCYNRKALGHIQKGKEEEQGPPPLQDQPTPQAESSAWVLLDCSG